VGDRDPRAELAAIHLEGIGPDTVQLRLPTGEIATLAVGDIPPASVTLAGWTFEGPALRVVRAGPGAAWLAAESVVAVSGAFRTPEPGPVEVRRLTDGRVLVGTTTAIELDARWAGGAPSGLRVLEHEGWTEAGGLERQGVLDAPTIARLQDRTGHRFLWLLLGDR
jgi:hypothetical protein